MKNKCLEKYLLKSNNETNFLIDITHSKLQNARWYIQVSKLTSEVVFDASKFYFIQYFFTNQFSSKFKKENPEYKVKHIKKT